MTYRVSVGVVTCYCSVLLSHTAWISIHFAHARFKIAFSELSIALINPTSSSCFIIIGIIIYYSIDTQVNFTCLVVAWVHRFLFVYFLLGFFSYSLTNMEIATQFKHNAVFFISPFCNAWLGFIELEAWNSCKWYGSKCLTSLKGSKVTICRRRKKSISL